MGLRSYPSGSFVPLQRHFHSLGLTNRFTPPRRSDPLVLGNLLRHWHDLRFLTSGIPIRTFQADFKIFTDASTQGWGAHMGDSQISGTWTRTDCNLHINCLELKAVVSALQHWAPVLQGHQVMIATDKLTVVYYNSLSETYSKLSERDSRPPISSESANIDRVVPPPQDRETCLQALGYTRRRHVCNSVELPTFSVHVSNSGATSPSGGCSVSGQAGEVNVHVSSIQSAQQSHSEAPVHPGGRSNSRSPLVAETVMVFHTYFVFVWITPVLSLPSRSSVPAGLEVCLGRKVVLSARMEALMRHYKAAGFSEVSRLAAAPKTPSTNRMYDDWWLRFAPWPAGQGFDTLDPTAAQIAFFFVYSF